MSEMTFGKIVQRLVLYVGMALAILTLFAAVIVLSKGEVGHVPGSWLALPVFTLCLFWVIVKQSRGYWRRSGFWLAIVGLLIVHTLAFVAVLRAYPQWREIWFVPVVVVEGALFGAILNLLFGERLRH